MKFKEYLQEEYICLASNINYKVKTPVYKNPSKKEISYALKSGEIRFIVDFKNKNLFIADSNYLIHNDILRVLTNEKEIKYKDVCDQNFWNHCYAGYAVLHDGKLDVTKPAQGCYDYILAGDFVDYDDTWLKQWFIMPFIKKVKKVSEEYLTRYNDYEIFKNSPIKEMKKINPNGVRLLINMKTKNYYVFDFSLLHDKAYHIIKAGKNTEKFDGESIVRAEGDFGSGKLGIIWFKPWIWHKNIDGKDIEKIFKDKGVPVLLPKPRPKYGIGEEYVFSGKAYWNDKEFPIFKNPSKKEIMEAADNKIVRFCIDLKKQNLFVWSPRLLHEDMAAKAIKEGLMDFGAYEQQYAVRNPYAFAVGKLVMGKIEIYDGDPDDQSNIDWDVWPKKVEKHGKDLSWLKHWFTQETYEEMNEI